MVTRNSVLIVKQKAHDGAVVGDTICVSVRRGFDVAKHYNRQGQAAENKLPLQYGFIKRLLRRKGNRARAYPASITKPFFLKNQQKNTPNLIPITGDHIK